MILFLAAHHWLALLLMVTRLHAVSGSVEIYRLSI